MMPDDESIDDLFLSDSRICLEEILEWLARTEIPKQVIIPETEKRAEELDEQELIIESPKTNFILYELEAGKYYVYRRKDNDDEEDDDEKKAKSKSYDPGTKDYGLFIPTGVVVQRVPQYILGTGVLGRAFIGQNYIEILDSLVGDAYQEVLTHEVFHIQYPEKKEMEIRQMTRNYVGDKAVYH